MHGEKNSEVTLSVSESDTVLKVLVADNGKGMKPETVEHLLTVTIEEPTPDKKQRGAVWDWPSPKGSLNCTEVPSSFPVSLLWELPFKWNFPFVKVN